MPHLIGITGRAGSGKDTFAAALAAAHPTTRLAFADPMRDVAEAVFGSRYATQAEKAAVDPYWATRLGEEWSTGRKILQRLGTDVFRNGIHTDIWLMAMARRLDAVRNVQFIALTDVRFDNEAEFVRSRGGIVVRMVNPHLPPATDAHASEQGVNDELVDHEFVPSSVEEIAEYAGNLAYILLDAPEPKDGMWDFTSEEYRSRLPRCASSSGGEVA